MTQPVKALHRQAQQAMNHGHYQQAHQYIIQLLGIDKHFTDAYFLLAMIASIHHNYAKAIELINHALKLEPNNSEYLAYLAKQYALSKEHVLANQFAIQAQENVPKNAQVWDTLGVVYSQVGLHKNAQDCFEEATKLKQDNSEYWFNLAAAQKFNGKFEQAKSNYKKCLALEPKHYKAHAAITSLGGINQECNHIEALTLLFENEQSIDGKLYLGHALAREYEALNDFDNAFHYLSSAKKKRLAQLDYSIDEDRQTFETLKQRFNLTAPKIDGYHSQEPIFIVGMPRTGTTRILSQHQDVTTAGELQNFGHLMKKLSGSQTLKVIDLDTVNKFKDSNFQMLGKTYVESTRAITGNTAKFIDKMPLNILYVGFILQALPHAKIVCLDRNLLDTIVSNYRQLFAVNYSYYNYAYDLKTATEYYVLFKDLMAFWLEQFASNFYVVNYENLVSTPHIAGKSMVEFCGLEWHENLLDITSNTASVATASAVQVRSPINSKSVGNWKKYDKYLDEVKAVLTEKGILF